MDEHSMSSWWNEGLSGEDRDEWCTALDTGVIGEDLLITLTDAQRSWLVDVDETSASMGPELQAFVAEECSKRLR
ncbi:hypothetical protein Cme02nite_01670 [Catellatospora methionotrophica]|uniref:Uncharacterized protein n=1 Tax=Catellatospora methionotrophica TaxID=121620 RepID=A0A8J3LFN7_9ACTN|nr:hypothetical protein [Catellatospora methionotrophica]GIG11835.1 hypothetical protein Cme02nite_01670 [Catellatospora methionotrophica]